jgi:hypothetical protein
MQKKSEINNNLGNYLISDFEYPGSGSNRYNREVTGV